MGRCSFTLITVAARGPWFPKARFEVYAFAQVTHPALYLAVEGCRKSVISFETIPPWTNKEIFALAVATYEAFVTFVKTAVGTWRRTGHAQPLLRAVAGQKLTGWGTPDYQEPTRRNIDWLFPTSRKGLFRWGRRTSNPKVRTSYLVRRTELSNWVTSAENKGIPAAAWIQTLSHYSHVPNNAIITLLQNIGDD